MDTLLRRYAVSMERLNFGHGSNQNHVNEFQVNHETSNPLFLPPNLANPVDLSLSSSSGSDGDSFDMSDCNHPVLKYISDILLEEDLEGKPCMLQDCLALQAAEKSFYDVLNRKDPPSPDQPPLFEYQSFENSDDDSSGTSHAQSALVQSRSGTCLASDSFSCNFGGIPNGKFGVIDLKRYQVPPGPDTLLPENEVNNAIRSKGRKNHPRADSAYAEEEGRVNKQPAAASADDSEPEEMFDEVLLCKPNQEAECDAHHEAFKSEGSGKLQLQKQPRGSKSTRSKKKDNKREVVDFSTLLTQCAQAVASYDQRTASELLKQIRKHSSPYGDATERLAHYFADGLQARLAGARTPSYASLVSMQTSATEILKAHQVYITSCPFKKMTHFVSNRTIMKLAENATSLHIIDFGISYGFQWPCLIQRLSQGSGGPPKLRMTAIELPQPGFRPAERVEETARRLEKYAQRFNVPFECNVIARKWATIQLEDLKIDRNELTVVNCMHRLKHIPDETVIVSSPRDTVLNLIRKINPDLFIHGVVNGTYNSPFFLTRFREALFHFSSLFDMFEATINREDEQRLLFEKAIYGRDILNVVACEGLERVERPETYKQWQVRNQRAGFKQVPLDQELLKRSKKMLKVMNYHNDFRIDEDGDWMLQEWKGRIHVGLAFWKPA